MKIMMDNQDILNINRMLDKVLDLVAKRKAFEKHLHARTNSPWNKKTTILVERTGRKPKKYTFNKKELELKINVIQSKIDVLNKKMADFRPIEPPDINTQAVIEGAYAEASEKAGSMGVLDTIKWIFKSIISSLKSFSWDSSTRWQNHFVFSATGFGSS